MAKITLFFTNYSRLRNIHENHECITFNNKFLYYDKFRFFEGLSLTDEEMIVVCDGASVAMTGGNHCGSGCDGGGGNVWDLAARNYWRMAENGQKKYVQ